MESGIPVAVNVTKGTGTAHSVICIGHGGRNRDLFKTARKLKYRLDPLGKSERALINFADFYDEYVVIDDNMPVYHLRRFDQLSLFQDMKANILAVPLNKRMHVDASDAEQQFLWILKDERLGLENWIPEGMLENEDIVMRIFMATSHSFKRYRTKTLPELRAKVTYSSLPMPHFIWVCELFRAEEYMGDESGTDLDDDVPHAFAEIILDATSPTRTNKHPFKSLLMMHYPGKIAIRYPEEKGIGFDEEVRIKEEAGGFPAFSYNLSRIMPCTC